MNKGLLFLLPMILALIVGLILNNTTMYAPIWAGAILLIGIVIVFFYIRTRKHDNYEPGKKL